MNTDEFLAKVNGGVGHFQVEWQTTVKPAAAHRARNLRKVSSATCMTGAEYRLLNDHAIRDADGNATGERTETGSLPWGEWETYPYVVAHKGQKYARIYTVDGTVRSIYLVDGEIVDRDTFNTFLTPSAAASKRPTGGTLTVKMDNLRVVK